MKIGLKKVDKYGGKMYNILYRYCEIDQTNLRSSKYFKNLKTKE